MGSEREQMTECPRCSGALQAGTRTLRRTIGGRTFERQVPALVCGACGERLVSSVDLAAFERQIAAEVMAAGIETPDAVMWVLDGGGLGPEAIGATWAQVGAWERGEAPVPAHVWPALRAAVSGPSARTGTAGE